MNNKQERILHSVFKHQSTSFELFIIRTDIRHPCGIKNGLQNWARRVTKMPTTLPFFEAIDQLFDAVPFVHFSVIFVCLLLPLPLSKSCLAIVCGSPSLFASSLVKESHTSTSSGTSKTKTTHIPN